MQKNILCTICARGGSKGVKNKNIRKINGLELIAYSIIQAYNSKLFEHIIISTDSDEIAKIAKKYGAEVFFKRKSELATDTAAKLPVIRDAFLQSQRYYQKEFEIIIDLDASAPLRKSSDIIKAYEYFIKSKKELLITACKARRNPYFNLIEQKKNGGFSTIKKANFTNRQQSPLCYDMNASIYIFKAQRLLKSNSLFGTKTALYQMNEESAFDIDSELDFKIVEFLLKTQNLKKEDF